MKGFDLVILTEVMGPNSKNPPPLKELAKTLGEAVNLKEPFGFQTTRMSSKFWSALFFNPKKLECVAEPRRMLFDWKIVPNFTRPPSLYELQTKTDPKWIFNIAAVHLVPGKLLFQLR
jgi:hypothetical protein